MFTFFRSQAVEVEAQLLFLSFPVISKITSCMVFFSHSVCKSECPYLPGSQEGEVGHGRKFGLFQMLIHLLRV